MKLTKKMLEKFPPWQRKTISDMYTNGQLIVTKNENEELPSGVTHIILVKRGKPPLFIRKRMA